MAWSYSGDPSSSDKDAVRFLVQDVDTNRQLVQDEEINWVLSENNNNVYYSSYYIAQSIARKFAMEATRKQEGDLELEYQERAKTYFEIAESLKEQSSTQFAPEVYVGGISVSDKNTQISDGDRVDPSFYRDQFSNNENLNKERKICQ